MMGAIADHNGGSFDECRKGAAAVIVAAFILMAGGFNAAYAEERTGVVEKLFTSEELHLRAAQRLRHAEAVLDALIECPSSQELCRARGYRVGSDSFTRCLIATEDTARTRAIAITKLGALVKLARALASLPTSSEINPAVIGAEPFKTTHCYDRGARRKGSCYDI